MGVGIAIGAVLGGMGIMHARTQGRRADKNAKIAFQQQEKAQRQASAAAGSQRLAQAIEQRRLRKKKPNYQPLLAKAKGASQQGLAGTFLTPLGNSDIA